MGFAETLRHLRTSRGMKQIEFARMIGILPRNVWRWESGTSEPRLKYLIKIADVFDVSLDALVGRPHKAVRNAIPEQLRAQAAKLLDTPHTILHSD